MRVDPLPAHQEPEPAPRRLAKGERARRIVDAAAVFFADHGFAGSTRELAAALGVTQALLYRYFRSKDDLVAAVLDRIGRGRADPARVAGLKDRTQPLAARLHAFYAAYVDGIDPVAMRLFVRANLDGGGQAQRVGARLTEGVLRPVLEELRVEAGLPDLDRRPLMRGEREIAMALHGALVFLAVRKHVYRMPMPDSLAELTGLQVRTYLPGALDELRRLHADGAPSLTLRQLRPRG